MVKTKIIQKKKLAKKTNCTHLPPNEYNLKEYDNREYVVTEIAATCSGYCYDCHMEFYAYKVRFLGYAKLYWIPAEAMVYI